MNNLPASPPMVQCHSRLGNAEEKDTWSYKQVCDNPETVVSHEGHEWSTNET